MPEIMKKPKPAKLNRGKLLTIQQSIPVDDTTDDGIFIIYADENKDKNGKPKKQAKNGGKHDKASAALLNTYSKTYHIKDMNYVMNNHDGQLKIVRTYQNLINEANADTTVAITLFNRTLSDDLIVETTQIPMNDKDGNNDIRKEINNVVRKKIERTGKNKIIQEMFITVAVRKTDIDSARRFFASTEQAYEKHLKSMGSDMTILDRTERFHLLHDIYRQGEENIFSYDEKTLNKQVTTFKEAFAPNAYEIEDEYIKVGNKYGRALSIMDYPASTEDDILHELTNRPKNMILTIVLSPISKSLALSQCRRVRTNVLADIAKFNRRQVAHKNFMAQPPHALEEKMEDVNDMENDLKNRDQSLFYAQIVITHFANTLEELDADTEAIAATAQSKHCRVIYQKGIQEDTFNTSLPYGLSFIGNWKHLTSEAVAAFQPFTALEMMQAGGIYYGINTSTNNVITYNIKKQKNRNTVIIGESGGGKSFMAKLLSLQWFLREPNADFIFVDPEREFGAMCEKLNGTVVRLSSNSTNYINPLELPQKALLNKEDNPIALKTEFFMSLCEQLLHGEITPQGRSIIERCIRRTYNDYLTSLDPDKEKPTMKDFYKSLKAQPEEEAAQIALGLEMFVEGNLDIFAHETNVDMSNRLIVYDTNDLGSAVKDVGMSIMLDAIFSKVAKNRAINRSTYIVIDEFWIMMHHKSSAEYMEAMWRRFRKYNAIVTGITQNIADLAGNEQGIAILNNTSSVIMLGQSQANAELLKQLFGLLDCHMTQIVDAPIGHGLLKFGKELISFENEFDRNTSVYRMITTENDAVETPKIT